MAFLWSGIDERKPSNLCGYDLGIQRDELWPNILRLVLVFRVSPLAPPGRKAPRWRDPVLYLENPPGVNRGDRRAMLDSLGELNQRGFKKFGDPDIQTRISQYEMAYRMQTSAPELMDLKGESKTTLDSYGVKPGESSFASNCLLARRLIERGSRFVQLYHTNWDSHGGPPNSTISAVTQINPLQLSFKI